MEASKCYELLQQYDKCEDCQTKDLTVDVHGNVFIRSCKCGWKIEIKDK